MREARAILSSSAESVALKCGIINVLAFDAGNPDEPERTAEVRALLQKSARDDPSEWVRAAAEEALR